MATINMSISTKVDSVTHKAPILFRFVGSRGFICRVKSGLHIKPDRWSDKESRVIIPRLATDEQKELVRLQKQLDELCNIILESFTNADKTTTSRQWLETIIDNYHFPDRQVQVDVETRQTFFDIFDEYLTKRKLSDWRIRACHVVVRALKRYELYKQAVTQKPFTLDLDTITPKTLHDIEAFLRSEYKFYDKYPAIYKAVPESRTPQPRGQNTINGILTKLRSLFIWANDTGYTTNNPFQNYKVEECVYGTPYYITIDERNKIYRTNLSRHPQLAIQRDIFVFQCLIGCRVGDLVKMTKANLIGGAIEYIPRKTKEGRPITVRVPLNSIAKEILTRYADSDTAKLLPFISEQKYNVAIKRIFTSARVNRMVTVVNPTTREEEKQPLNKIASSHIARRCFVGNLYRQVKDPNLVGALSGHKEGSKAFARYREIDENMKNELVKLLE